MKTTINGKPATCITSTKNFSDSVYQDENGEIYKVGFNVGDISHGKSSFGSNFEGLVTLEAK